MTRGKGWSNYYLDGRVLAFNRATGVNVLMSGDETAHVRQVAPRVMQVSLTNACNKDCSFCYRPLDAASAWTFDEMVELARFAADWGVLELAFGGGEPLVFKRFAELMKTIWSETSLCPNFTTNGLLLTPAFLRDIRGHYGQLQLSIYEEDDYWSIIDLLAAEQARFGLNYLITPERVRTLEVDVYAFMQRGVRDILFLSYKGKESSLHLSPSECRAFDRSVAKLHRIFAGKIDLKVDVCWGSRLVHTPRLLHQDDCGAGDGFISIGSHKEVMACSFAQHGTPFQRVEEIREIYTAQRHARAAVREPGCDRLPGFGFGLREHELVPLRLGAQRGPVATERGA